MEEIDEPLTEAIVELEKMFMAVDIKQLAELQQEHHTEVQHKLMQIQAGISAPLPLMYSFEMKQASKGQRYYDIKIMNIQAGQLKEAMQLYDELDAELSSRALLGE